MTIPFLESKALRATMERTDLAGSQFPLFQFFPRRMNNAESVIIRGQLIQTRQGDYIGRDAAPVPATMDAVTEQIVKPLRAAQKVDITNEDLVAYRDAYSQASIMNPDDAASVMDRLTRRTTSYVRTVATPVMEAMHSMLVRALLGSGTFTIGGVSKTISYGLTALTAPSTSWATTASATPVADIYAALEEFNENSGGKPCTHIFYNPKMFSTYLAPNTDWTNYVKGDPQTTRAFLGLGGPGEFVDPSTGAFTDQVFGVTWVPVRGSALVSGASTQRWATDKLTFAYLPPGEDVLTMEMSADMENEGRAEMALRTLMPDAESQEVPKATMIAADNGAAAIHVPAYVQTWDVAS